jgi:hypothetical protein
MRRTDVSAVLVIALLVAACGASTRPAATSDAPGFPSPSASELAVVAWSSAMPLAYETPTPTSVPSAAPCTADQLGVAAYAGGATGSMAGGINVWNTGPAPCLISGRPLITILNKSGEPLLLDEGPMPSDSASQVVLSAGGSSPAPEKGASVGTGGAEFFWSNWCGRALDLPLAVVVTLPDGSVIRSGRTIDGVPRCDAPKSPSSLTVGNFSPIPAPDPTDPPILGIEALQVALETPDHATPGHSLQYVAILRNPTSEPISLDPCPAYLERLNARGGPVVADYLLNCSAQPFIDAGQSVRFAMVLDIPASLAADPDAALVWSLDPWFSEGFPPVPPDEKIAMPVVAP